MLSLFVGKHKPFAKPAKGEPREPGLWNGYYREGASSQLGDWPCCATVSGWVFVSSLGIAWAFEPYLGEAHTLNSRSAVAGRLASAFGASTATAGGGIVEDIPGLRPRITAAFCM